MSVDIKIKIDDHETLKQLSGLSPRQFMIAWTTAIRQMVQSRAREKIGGDFGDQIARNSIQTDTTDPMRHEIYTGGENGYIAEHIHTGGTIRPKHAKFLAIPIDKSVKGLYAREVPGLVFLRKKEDGPNGRAYLARPMKRKIKPLFVLKRTVDQRPRPWWPDDAEAEAATVKFFEENF
nr:MAG TPA: hypothetical protein [Caudoviricetes sp.]